MRFSHTAEDPTSDPHLNLVDKSEEVRRLGMGRLLGDLVEKMHLQAHNTKSAPKLLVHATHDTGLAALLNTLDVFDDRLVVVSL